MGNKIHNQAHGRSKYYLFSLLITHHPSAFWALEREVKGRLVVMLDI